MSSKSSKTYGKIRLVLLQKIFKYHPIAIFSHWLFQSLLYMDKTERLFKISVDLILTILFMLVLQVWINLPLALIISFLISHTLNFIFNGQYWGILKCYGLVSIQYDDFTSYVNKIANRARREPSINRLIIYGSITRKEWTPSSDLDGRIYRRQGLFYGIQSCWFLLKERTMAMWFRFPLDVYIMDSMATGSKLNLKEEGIDLMVDYLS